MKAILILPVLVALSFANPLPSETTVPRQYYPEEDDPYRIEYLLLEDENGTRHYENLRIEHPELRATESDVLFYLYTKSNSNTNAGYVIPATDFSRVASSPFDPRRKTILISHGWNNNFQSSVNTLVRAAALRAADVNVFVLDWSGPANKFYTSARSVVPIVGGIEANFINYLMDTYGLTPKDFVLVGHSLGAHVAGCAGAAVNGLVDTIIGLDPAGPLFTLSNTDNRIDPTDAETVHIIHTNGGLLGFASSIGDADYFPNGGSSQPGCGLDLAGTCAHGRAYEYLAESIVHSGFHSVLCGSYRSFSRGECTSNTRSVLGELNIDKTANGDYYLDTASTTLYALGDDYF